MIYIIGGGGHALSVLSLLRQSCEERVSIITVDDAIDCDLSGDVELLRVSETSLLSAPSLVASASIFYMGISCPLTKELVLQRYSSKLGKRFQLSGLVGATAVVSKLVSRIGDGVHLHDFSYVGPSVTLGRHVTINTRATVEHGTCIDDFSFVGPGAVVLGNAKVGKGCFIGANAVIGPSVAIGDGRFVRANSVVTSSTSKDLSCYLPKSPQRQNI